MNGSGDRNSSSDLQKKIDEKNSIPDEFIEENLLAEHGSDLFD